jgi:phosphoserine phosphatase
MNSIYFDFDSTLARIETLDELARIRGVFDEVKRMTDAAMNGEAKLEDILPRKTNLIAPSREMIEGFVASWHEDTWFTLGARETIERLREMDWKVRVLTANFHAVIDPLAQLLGIEASDVLANDLKFYGDGSYAGVDPASRLLTTNGKGVILREERAQDAGRVVFVGDSVSDLSCKGVADVMIGFGGVVARPKVRAEADVFVEGPSLLGVLAHL